MGHVSVEGILNLHCVLAGYLSSRVEQVLCSVPKSCVQVAKSLCSGSKVLCPAPKSYDQFLSLMFSSNVLSSLPKSYAQLQSLMFSSAVLCSVPKSYVQFQKS